MPTQSQVPTNANIQFNEVTYGVHGTPARVGRPSGQVSDNGAKDRGSSAMTPANGRDNGASAKNSTQRVLVSDISLTIQAGETLVLLGRSGSGKTTLLKLINGMHWPSKEGAGGRARDRGVGCDSIAARNRLRDSGGGIVSAFYGGGKCWRWCRGWRIGRRKRLRRA